MRVSDRFICCASSARRALGAATALCALTFVTGNAASQPIAPITALPAANSNKPTSIAFEPGSITIGPASITYYANAGDTLTSIAQQYTDKGSNWTTLGKINHIEKDSAIPIGMPILIPGELLGDIPAKATVVAMTGTVTATSPDGGAQHLGIGATVAEGTRIQTSSNSFLTLSLVDQSRISVPSNSRVQVAKLRTARYLHRPRTEILLLRGKVESRVSPLEANQGKFEVRTPLSVAGVRGTHFRVGLLGDGAGNRVATETLEGKVAVSKPAKTIAPDTLVLSRAKGNITDSQTVGPAVDLLPAPALVPGSGANRSEYASSRIQVLPVSGARAYHLQIAKDQDAMNVLTETTSATPTLAVVGLPEGPYFARVSAIDALGIEGVASVTPVTLLPAELARNGKLTIPTPPKVAGSDSKSMTLRWASISGQAMRLQIARDLDFSSLMVNRPGTNGEAQLARPAFGTYYARVELLDERGNVQSSSFAQPLIVTDQWIMNDGEPIPVKQGSNKPAQ